MICTTNNEHVEARNDRALTNGDDNNNDHDQLPDYSFYDDDVNASILRVLRHEEDDADNETNIEQQVSNKIDCRR
jgi:hypothetical protein